MPSFSSMSNGKLLTCDPLLQMLMREVVEVYDCSIIEGHRGEAKQNEYYAAGRSKVKYPDGKHNSDPSKAVDAGPYLEGRGIPWPQTPAWLKDLNSFQKEELNKYIKDLNQFYHFGGFVEGVAAQMEIPVRWGGDWDGDRCLSDQTFDDLPHFELR